MGAEYPTCEKCGRYHDGYSDQCAFCLRPEPVARVYNKKLLPENYLSEDGVDVDELGWDDEVPGGDK